MRLIKKTEKHFKFSVTFLTLMSAVILFIPLIDTVDKYNRFVVVIMGLLFWICAITGYISIYLANKERKKIISKYPEKNVNSRLGIVTFFSNKLAKVFDITMVLSFIAFTVINFTTLSSSYIAYVLMFLLVLSINMHCIFNGRVYKFIKTKNDRRVDSHE